MYWTIAFQSDIQRSNLDGSGVEDFVNTKSSIIYGIALDVSGGKMYWAGWHGTGQINRSNLDGSGVETLVTGLDEPEGIALGLVPIEIEAGPDLEVFGVSVSHSRRQPGQSFKLSVKVRNNGTEQASATTLRYYRSGDVTISTSDTQLGTFSVNSLASLADRAYSIDLTAPTSEGYYYYGACVESVSGESNTDNNCFGGGRVSVEIPSCRLGMILSYGESCRTSDGRILTCNFRDGCTVH